MSNAPSKPVSFSRPKVGYFSNRPRTVCMLMLLSCWPVCTGVTGQGIDCRLPEDDMIVSKHVAV